MNEEGYRQVNYNDSLYCPYYKQALYYCPYCYPEFYVCPYLNRYPITRLPIDPSTPIAPIQHKPLIIKYPMIPDTPEKWATRVIDAKWQTLKDELGPAVTVVEDLKPGYRIRYQKGAIYLEKLPGLAHAVYGAIYNHYRKLKEVKSWLGFPITDVSPLKLDEGEVSSFENGEIYWWPGDKAIDISEFKLAYKGINCFSTTSGPGSDEVYASIGVVAPTGDKDNPVETPTIQTKLYKDVDDGDSVPDYIEIYRGKPYGLNLSFLLMEHDQGDPNKYLGAVKASVQAAAAVVETGIVAYTGPIIGGLAAPLLQEAVPEIAKGINNLLGTGDDTIGNITVPFTAKEVIQLANTGESIEKQIRFNYDTPSLTGDGGSYKGYFTFSKV